MLYGMARSEACEREREAELARLVRGDRPPERPYPGPRPPARAVLVRLLRGRAA
jgi:hypothetical protein